MTSGTHPPGGGSHLPDLGPRGEGWLVGQFALLALLLLAGLPGLGRVVSAPETSLGWVRFVAGVAMVGVAGLVLARAFTDLGDSLSPLPRPRADARMVHSGTYAHVRHPIYAALMLAAVGWSLLTASLLAFAVALVLAVFLDAKARREEDWLTERYAEYADYRRRSRRFVPGIY